MPSEKIQPFERHRIRPNPDGSVDYFSNPIFSRKDWYEMVLTSNFYVTPTGINIEELLNA